MGPEGEDTGCVGAAGGCWGHFDHPGQGGQAKDYLTVGGCPDGLLGRS